MRKFIFSIISVSLVFFTGCSLSGTDDAYDDAREASTRYVLDDPLDFKADGYTHIPLSDVSIKPGPRHNDRIYVRDIGPLREVFLDSNKYQYAWAERIGIEPVSDLNRAYRTRRPLVKIVDCEAYGLDSLTHSLPYLVPEAAQLLERIGYDFIDTLARRGVDGYKIKVTSLLRTPATVRALRRRNRNAVDSSTHKFGTTFDISWSRYVCADTTRTIHEGDLKNVLAEVIYNLRRQGKCLVVFERKSPCFHITVTPGRKPGEM